ncbi:MAG: hypothetical protein NW241_19170 [Bacteroidia bacterium]|nr:hypothetical protein [Bacteroidia bacterium]
MSSELLTPVQPSRSGPLRFPSLLPAQIISKPVIDFVSACNQSYVHPGARMLQFRAADPAAFAQAVEGAGAAKLFRTLLSQPEVPASLTELNLVPDAGLLRELKITEENPFLLDGQLAELLYRQGAYPRSRGNQEQVKLLAEQAVRKLTGGRFDAVRVFAARAPWAAWFAGAGQDYTWMVLDPEMGFWLFCVSDAA